jgi:hypothetical protein
MKKIKILHVTKGFYPETFGGIETFIDLLLIQKNYFNHFLQKG